MHAHVACFWQIYHIPVIKNKCDQTYLTICHIHSSFGCTDMIAEYIVKNLVDSFAWRDYIKRLVSRGIWNRTPQRRQNFYITKFITKRQSKCQCLHNLVITLCLEMIQSLKIVINFSLNLRFLRVLRTQKQPNLKFTCSFQKRSIIEFTTSRGPIL